MHLIDTSAWIDYFRKTGDSTVRKRVADLLRSGRASWCEMVLLELQSSPKSRQSTAIGALKSVLPMIAINRDCWAYACELARGSKIQGKAVPNTDALIYATARIHRLKLAHNDKHFDWLDEMAGQTIARQ